MKQDRQQDDRVLTAREAAKFLGLSPRLLKLARERAGLPHRRVDGKFAYPLSGLRRWAGLEK